MAGGGACVAGGAWPGGHVRQGVHGREACMVQGCVVGGHAWQGGGMHGRGGHVWWGCVHGGGMRGRGRACDARPPGVDTTATAYGQ